ncbi:glycosyltransferase [Pelagibacteraceae bacterium]|nr:glycosyltransferase [Pelagibacteraceae bacterium]MDC0952387.1 glycosyltransferase [Pelagibacteraceae bacterium]
MKKKLYIFSNESIFLEDNKYYCDNLDLKSTPEGLNKKFEVNLFGRRSSKKRSHEIKIKKIKVFNNIFSYISSVISAAKNQDTKFLIISITPYTFFISLFIKILGRKPIVYLRSDGYGEYKAIFGKIGPLIYHFMFSVVGAISNLISCRDYILRGKKGKTINPSQLDSVWLRQPKNIEIKNFRLLYVGRIRVEKGIYSLADLIRNKRDISLTVVGAEKDKFHKINQSNIKIFNTQNNKTKLIKHYDDHNIFILPSFTEGHPMVLLEALARRRPVIIFDDIKHVIGEKKGIFVSRRNFISLFGTLNNIKKNYKKIQKEMKKNKLPTNKEFIDKFVKLIDDFK